MNNDISYERDAQDFLAGFLNSICREIMNRKGRVGVSLFALDTLAKMLIHPNDFFLFVDEAELGGALRMALDDARRGDIVIPPTKSKKGRTQNDPNTQPQPRRRVDSDRSGRIHSEKPPEDAGTCEPAEEAESQEGSDPPDP